MGVRKKVKRKVVQPTKPAGQIQAERKFLHRRMFERAVVEGARPSELCEELGVTRDKLERIVTARQLLLMRVNRTALSRKGSVERERLAKEVYKLRLTYLWQEALSAWRKSLADQATEKQSAGSESERTETTVRPQTGDARYLQMAWRIAEEAYRLEGDTFAIKGKDRWKESSAACDGEVMLDEDEKGQGYEHELSVEQRRAIASGLLAALRERGGEVGAVGADCRRDLPGSAAAEVGSASTLA